MGKGLGKDKRKEAVPVLLTGKAWVPSAAPPGRQPVKKGTILLCLFLGAIVGWFLLSSKTSKPAPEISEAVASATVAAGLAPPAQVAVLASGGAPVDPAVSSGALASSLASSSSENSDVSGSSKIPSATKAILPVAGSEPVFANNLGFPASGSLATTEIALGKPAVPASKTAGTEKISRNPFPDPLVWVPRGHRAKAAVLAQTEVLPLRKDTGAMNADIETTALEIPGVPVIRRKSQRMIGVRPVLTADGWDLVWENRRKKVIGSRKNGDTLEITSGARFMTLNGTSVALSARPVLAKNGQLFVSLEMLNAIFGNRLAYVGKGSDSLSVTVRLTGAVPSDTPSGPSLGVTAACEQKIIKVKVIRRQGQVLVSLRQILEADGWKVHWMGASKGVVCRKAADQILLVGPNKNILVWNMEPLISRPAPQVSQGRMFVATKALETVLKKRLQVDFCAGSSNEAHVRLSEV